MDAKEPVTKDHSKWLLWIDNKIEGYVNTLDEARVFLDNTSLSLRRKIEENTPYLKVEFENNGDQLNVNCRDPGYVWDSQWVAHTLQYKEIYEQLTIPKAELRVPRIGAIQKQERETNPVSRTPTPINSHAEPGRLPINWDDVPAAPPLPPLPTKRRGRRRQRC